VPRSVSGIRLAWEEADAGAICAFLYHARRNGYTTEPCPIVGGAGNAEPDAAIENDEEYLYVEVQGRGGETWRRADKWRNQYRLQGRVAICADTPILAERLAREAQIAGVPIGYLTNLTDLADGFVKGLWTHRWRSQHSYLCTRLLT
jgi:hypothetical protein